MRYRCLKAQDADEQNQNPHRKPSAMNASDNRVGVNRFQFAWLPDRQGSTIDVVCDHIPERGGNRVKTAGTVHEADLALLYQEETASGQRSNFNKLIGRETAEAREHGETHASRHRGH